MPVKDWLPAPVRAAAIERKLKSGEALFRLGDKTTGLCEIVAGRVRLARVDRSGHEIVLHVASPGETIAEASLFSPTYHCDAIASTNATVRVYPKREVLAAFDRDPKAAQAFSATLARQVMNLRTRRAEHPLRARARKTLSRAQRRRRPKNCRATRYDKGYRRRARAYSRSALSHPCRARTRGGGQARQGKDRHDPSETRMIRIICSFGCGG